jgi:hypothetical protein|tara:strand:- start:223 stop:801 length:579 start_codon:yes stop_codon:yes gene_type:complete
MSGKVQGLNKEFQKRDVERMRNLIQGKYGEKNGTSVGFSAPHKEYKEGETWEKDDRTWTIKDGIKQNVTKLDKAKLVHTMPLFCPACKKVMKNRNDKAYYNIHKTCFKCVIKEEDKMKRNGTFEAYRQGIKNDEIDHRIEDFKVWMKEKVSETNNQYVSEAGDVETWKGKINHDQIDTNMKEVIEYLESLKK